MNRWSRSLCFLGLITSLAACLASANETPTAYEQAMALIAEGKRDEAIPLLKKIREHAKTVRLNAAIIIVSEDLKDELDEESRKRLFPAESDPGTAVLTLEETDQDGKKMAVRVTPWNEEQISSFEKTIRQSKNGETISTFGVQLFDAQLLQIALIPEAGFWVIDPKFNRLRKRRGKIPLNLRPSFAESGELWVRFSDHQKSDEPFPPILLDQGLLWYFPGAIHEPPEALRYKWRAAADFTPLVKVPPGQTLIVWGFEGWLEREVETGVALLNMIPVIKRFFTSRSTIKMRSEIFVILKFDVPSGKTKQE